MSDRQDDINVTSQTSREKEKDYDRSDLEALMRRNEGWRNWDDPIRWLKQNGDASNEFTPGEVRNMVQDFEELKNKGVPFTPNADQIAQQVHAR